VGTIAGLVAMEKSISCPCQESNPDFSVIQPKTLSLYKLRQPGSFYTSYMYLIQGQEMDQNVSTSFLLLLSHEVQDESLGYVVFS
jgi:hypothetical protein